MNLRKYTVLIPLLAALSGCGPASAPDGSGNTTAPAASSSAFRFNNGTEPASLDPAIMTGEPEFNIAMQIFEGLLTPDPQTLKPIPGMAETWEISDDLLTYTFHLRTNAKWSNGDPVTAHDFVYSWRRVLTPATASSYQYQLYYVKNAEAFYKGEVTDWEQVGIKAPDDHTLVVELRAPCAYFLDLCRFHTLMPVNKKCVEADPERWTRPENIVTNGPYLLKSHSINDRMVMTRNPDYYDAANVKLEEIVAFAIDDQNTSFQKYEAGELEVTKLPLPLVPAALQRPDHRRYSQMTTYFYRLNVTRAPLDDARIRKALAMAIDKKTLVDVVLRAGQQPANTFVPPVLESYHGPDGLAFNPEAARQLLAEAGHPNGEGLGPVTILYNTSDAHRTIAEFIQADWKQNLNIDAQMENQEWKVYIDSTNNLNYQVARAAWIGDYPDPNTFLDMFVTDGGNNRTGWGNAEYDGLIKSAAEETDAGKRFDLFRRAETILCAEEAVIIPIYFYVGVELVKPYVKGYYENAQSHHPLKYVTLEN